MGYKDWIMSNRAALILALVCALFCSAYPSPGADSPKEQGEEATSAAIKWRASEQGPTLEADMFVAPVLCGRGYPVLRALVPEPQKLPNMDGIISLSGDKAPVLVDINKASAIKEAHVRSYFATSRDIVVLVSGADEVKLEKQKVRITPPEGSTEAPREVEQSSNRAEQHSYVLHFDFDGGLKSVHKLEGGSDISLVSEFESGQLLLGRITGKDEFQWAIADADGTIRALLTLPDETTSRENAAKSFKVEGFGGQVSASSLFGLTQLVPYGNSLVVFARGENAPLYIINEGGAIRKLKIRLPAGIEPDSAIPAETGFYIKGRLAAKNGDTPGGGAIFRIDMETGEVLQKYDAGDVPVSGVVCIDGDQFVALHREGGVTTLLKGSAK